PVPTSPPAMQNPVTKTYCVTGTSNGSKWSWGIDLDNSTSIAAPEPLNDDTGPPQPPGNESDFVNSFISSVNAQCPGIAGPGVSSACTTGSNPAAFTITAPAPFEFYVASQGNITNTAIACKVAQAIGGNGGCSFNPLIYLTGTGIPALNLLGFAAAI